MSITFIFIIIFHKQTKLSCEIQMPLNAQHEKLRVGNCKNSYHLTYTPLTTHIYTNKCHKFAMEKRKKMDEILELRSVLLHVYFIQGMIKKHQDWSFKFYYI